MKDTGVQEKERWETSDDIKHKKIKRKLKGWRKEEKDT